MKNKIISLLMIMVLVFSFVACNPNTSDGVNPDGNPKSLATPVVTISDTGLATWQRVAHAEFYRVLINDVVSNLNYKRLLHVRAFLAD